MKMQSSLTTFLVLVLILLWTHVSEMLGAKAGAKAGAKSTTQSRMEREAVINRCR